jgi:hypothetical protein
MLGFFFAVIFGARGRYLEDIVFNNRFDFQTSSVIIRLAQTLIGETITAMPYYLLTGAGFSKNWGGLVASEFFGRLLGQQLDRATRDLLFASRAKGGFEDVMTQLQMARNNSQQDANRLIEFTAAIAGIFNNMNNQFAYANFEFQNEVRYMVRAFLERFEAIFTLNQDGLLEHQYFHGFVGGRWDGAQMPGVVSVAPAPHVRGTREERLGILKPDNKFQVRPRAQPYFKLHGSANWIVDEQSDRLLILGGQKAQAIALHPLLTRYLEEFTTRLMGADACLMIIGYGFNDQHINEIIGRAVENGLRIFIVDPTGVDVFDKFDKTAQIPGRPDAYAELLRPSIIGESKIPLSQSFGTNHGEHDYLQTFFG